MKRVVEVPKTTVEVVEGSGSLESYLGKPILLLCANYFYTGRLTGINETCVELSDAYLVYETGAWNTKGFTDAQKLPAKVWTVQLGFIESFGEPK